MDSLIAFQNTGPAATILLFKPKIYLGLSSGPRRVSKSAHLVRVGLAWPVFHHLILRNTSIGGGPKKRREHTDYNEGWLLIPAVIIHLNFWLVFHKQWVSYKLINIACFVSWLQWPTLRNVRGSSPPVSLKWELGLLLDWWRVKHLIIENKTRGSKWCGLTWFALRWSQPR